MGILKNLQPSEPRFHVVHVVPGISEEASGPSYSTVRLCEAVSERGLDVTLATLKWHHIQYPAFAKTFPVGLGPKRLARSPALRRWLENEAACGKIQIIHNHSIWAMPNVYPGQIAKRFKIPYVCSPRGALSPWIMNHGSKVKRVFWPLVQRPALESVTCWHATSESEYQEIRALGFRQPVAVIPNGIDVPELGEKRPRRTRTLLFLGRIHPKKGLDMLLPAWAAVQDRFPDWRLRIVGDDAGYFEPSGYLAKMRKLALELNLKRVEFTGALYGEAKWRAYHEADLFILPTHSENFGMTVAEALAAGTPAIVTKGAPWSALTTHNCGWWVDIKIDSLTRAMKEAFEEPDETLFEMGRRGRKWMIEEFSWDRISHQLTATYFWLLHKGEVPECVR